MIKQNNNLYSLDEILNTGTLFKNIYKPYKKTPNIIPESNEEKIMFKIQQLEIALMDLNLYLDIYPNDSSFVNLYNKYNNELENLKKDFESKYYSLSTNNSSKNSIWKWVNKKWPWDGENNV